ncbi:MAG: RNA polymerase sigma factor [Bacteroidia bacterium]|nr:RNA polymerase sigma factor [Bacteroidia bacterium]
MTVREFNECVDQHADGLYRFILKNIRDEEKAKDIVQDTYEKLWQKVSEVPATNAKSLMFTTAYRTMIDAIRRDKKLEFMEEAELPESAHQGQYSDLKQVLNAALQRLPEVQRSVVMLRDYEGYSYTEIGQIMSLSEQQVKVYIFRARKALKEMLGKIENLV